MHIKCDNDYFWDAEQLQFWLKKGVESGKDAQHPFGFNSHIDLRILLGVYWNPRGIDLLHRAVYPGPTRAAARDISNDLGWHKDCYESKLVVERKSPIPRKAVKRKNHQNTIVGKVPADPYAA